MPSFRAADSARSRSRAAIATISQSGLAAIAGSTFSRPILAVLTTPHFNGFMMMLPLLSRAGHSVNVRHGLNRLFQFLDIEVIRIGGLDNAGLLA